MAKYKANKEKEANLLKGSESDRTTVDKTGWYKSDPKYLKKEVNSERREAKNRVAFYGGKNAAKNAIEAENRYRKQKISDFYADKAATYLAGSTLAAFGSLAIAGIKTSTAVALGSTCFMGSLAASVALPAYAIVKGMEAAEESDKRAKRQHMYTDDLDVTGNKVTVSSTDDDD